MAAPDAAPAPGGAAGFRHYEFVLMLKPDKHEASDAIADSYEQAIAGAGGGITRRENWGRRQLAYQIGRMNRAAYVLLNFSCPESACRSLLDALAGKYEFDNDLIRALLVRKREQPDGDSAILAAQRRAEAAEAAD